MVQGLSKTKCKVTRIWESLEGDDRRIFREAINDVKTWPAISLERELKSRGVQVSNDTILAHRHGICCCEGEKC